MNRESLIQQHAAEIARHAKAIADLQAPVSHEGKLEQIMAEGRMRMWLAIHRVIERHSSLWQTEQIAALNTTKVYVQRLRNEQALGLSNGFPR